MSTFQQIQAVLENSQPGRGAERSGRVLLRNWRRFLLGAGAVIALGCAYLALAPMRYTANVTVMAAPRQQDITGTDAIPSAQALREPDIEGELQLMIAPALLRRVAHQLNLDAVAGDRGPSLLARLFGRPGAPVGDAEGAKALASAAASIGRNLKVTPAGRSTMVQIDYTGSSPAMAAEVANAIASNYIEFRYRSRVELAERATAFLRERAAGLQADVVRVEHQVADAEAAAQSDGRDLDQLKAQLNLLNERIVVAHVEQDRAASRLHVARERAGRDGMLSLLGWEAAGDPVQYIDKLRGTLADLRQEAARLSGELGSQNPNVERLTAQARIIEGQLSAEADARLRGLEMNLDAASGQVATMEAALQVTRSRTDRLAAAAVPLAALQREAAASRAVYESMVNRWKATAQVGFNDAESWVVSPASPPASPSSPNIPLIVAATAIAALGVGASAAGYGEYVASRTLRSGEDVERLLGPVRSLGMMPKLRDCRRVRDAVTAFAAASDPMFTEAAMAVFASLHAGLQGDGFTGRGRTVLVTSALPSEGKSSTAALIAAAAGAAGQRVAIVDLDLRAPSIREAFAVAPTPGVAAFITGNADVHSLLALDVRTGVWVLPAVPGGAHPQHLLHSAAVPALLDKLRSEFDLVVLDSPPVLSVSDARVLARLADHTVLVACWSRTPWAVARLALRTLQEGGARVSGVVLSQVDLQQLAATALPEAEPYQSPYRKYYRPASNSVPA